MNFNHALQLLPRVLTAASLQHAKPTSPICHAKHNQHGESTIYNFPSSTPVLQPPPCPTTRLRIAEDALKARDFERCRIICSNLVRLPALHPVLKARAYVILGSISGTHEALEHLRDAVKTAGMFKEGPGVEEFEVIREGMREALRQAELLVLNAG